MVRIRERDKCVRMWDHIGRFWGNTFKTECVCQYVRIRNALTTYQMVLVYTPHSRGSSILKYIVLKSGITNYVDAVFLFVPPNMFDFVTVE
jgi:hypothetical protein